MKTIVERVSQWRQQAKKRKASNKGYTLIETIISMLVIASAGIIMVLTLSTALKIDGKARLETKNSLELKSKVESTSTGTGMPAYFFLVDGTRLTGDVDLVKEEQAGMEYRYFAHE